MFDDDNQVLRETDLFLAGHARFRAGKTRSRARLGVGFVKLLGCGDLLYTNTKSTINITESSNLEAIQRSLPSLLVAIGKNPTAPVDATFLLAALNRHQCWKICLEKEESAYILADRLIAYVETYTDDFYPDAAAKNDILALLNDWLKPVSPWKVLPTAHCVCLHMFDPLWCILRLPSENDFLTASASFEDMYINNIINQELPPFLPGLCPAQIIPLSVPLPNDFAFSA
jgi:hypothetical protein